ISMLVDNGTMPAADALAAVERFDPASDRYLTRATLGGFRQAGLLPVIRERVLGQSMRPQWAKYIHKLFGVQARKLGFVANKGDDDELRLLRPLVVEVVGTVGGDAHIAAEAKKLALKFLDDKTAVEPDMQIAVLNIAAYNGDAAVYDKFLATA